MALIKRQTVSYEIYDDQSPTLWNSFSGNWTRYQEQGFNNNTITATPTPGAYVSFTFSGASVVGLGPVGAVLISSRIQGLRRGSMAALCPMPLLGKSFLIRLPITKWTGFLVNHSTKRRLIGVYLIPHYSRDPKAMV